MNTSAPSTRNCVNAQHDHQAAGSQAAGHRLRHHRDVVGCKEAEARRIGFQPAPIRMATKVTGLLEDRGRVTGVRVAHNGSESPRAAPLVVGADGRNSTIAALVGARKYNLTSKERFGYWTFFEGAEPGPDPAFIFHRWADRLVFACPADGGLYLVGEIPDLRELPRFRQDLEGSFMEYARSCRPVAEALSGARRVGRFFGMLRWEGFFREASGRGWVLVGDAGHFKDPRRASGSGMRSDRSTRSPRRS
jgi:2-polyprenyl-6-methoxyphenol hydroxylase-like FAD-dependent oxidoreductase